MVILEFSQPGTKKTHCTFNFKYDKNWNTQNVFICELLVFLRLTLGKVCSMKTVPE